MQRSERLVVDVLPGEESPDSEDGAVRETFRFEWTLPLIGGGGRLAGPLEAILGKHFATTTGEGAESCASEREEETVVVVELRTSRGEVAHLAGIGSHSTSSCSGRGCEVASKLDQLFSKWFPMSRDVLSFEAAGDDAIAASSSARVSHQDGITRESLKRFLALSSPQGTDHGVSSLLRAKLALALEEAKDFQVVRNRSRRGRGREARDASARYVGLEISISVTESVCVGPGRPRTGRAHIRTQLQWVSTSPPFAGNGTSGAVLVDGARDWVARHLRGPCRFCERSALLVSAGAGAGGLVEFDLRGPQGLGPPGALKPEAPHNGSPLWQETSVTKAIKGHPSSLRFTEVYDILPKRTRPLSLCLESYLAPHATPLFSASTVTVRSLSGDAGEAKSWPLLDLRGTRATYLPSTAATASSASLLSLCLDLDRVLDKGANTSGGEAAWAVTLYLEYRKSFPQVFGLRADRSAGLYLPSTLVYPSGCRACGHFLAPSRVMCPLPDASMPYNASIITCTVFALCVGLTLKTLGFVVKPISADGAGPAPTRGKKLVRKAIKVGVNLLVLGILAGVVIVADSEVGFHLKTLLSLE